MRVQPLRQVRLERGLTLQALADASGVHRVTINRIELRNHQPALETLWKLAEALEVSPAELIERPA